MDSAEGENEGSPWGNCSPGVEEERKAVHQKIEKKNNVLPLWGNERTMNLNPMILTNIQSSHYFKVNLYELKTYHEVIDEIYYKVTHLEPWEKGSRKTAGQTGMCGGVRGVGAGGIVSTAFCLLYKLFTLKLTRKQVNGLLTHPDSPYIRGLGFMYIRYTQPPADLWDWYDAYLEDPEEMDVKAGGGQVMTIGEMLRAFLTKLEWFSSLFPRIPVPIQQKLEKKLNERFPPVVAPLRQPKPVLQQPQPAKEARHIPDEEVSFGEAERFSRLRRADGVGGTNAALPGRGAERDRRRTPDRDLRRGHSSEVSHSRGYSKEKRAYSKDKSPAQCKSPVRHKSRDRSPVRYRERSRGRSPARRDRSPRHKDREYRQKSRDRKDRHRHNRS
ncbi:pre-mRNA-splicing factor 38B isoform X2 [Cryptotermes secundus]|uniref:pre-mRNA-splicing factor 38B isoform X2 n=2 Tax=Cryptotermes secundus TaxID=105785 RepID=UPI000CD7D47D|nr:pre-mRNA-splicing factor 38B isoform X2 [Cryptotermes secundus]